MIVIKDSQKEISNK